MTRVQNRGYLKAWKDNRGFGFIKPDDGSPDVFIHISALKDMARRPNKGDMILYDITQDADGKNRAINASIEGVPTLSESKSLSVKKWLIALSAAIGMIGAAIALMISQ